MVSDLDGVAYFDGEFFRQRISNYLPGFGRSLGAFGDREAIGSGVWPNK